MEPEVITPESDREIIERTLRLARNTLKMAAAVDARPTVTMPAHIAERLAVLAQQTLTAKPADESPPKEIAAEPG